MPDIIPIEFKYRGMDFRLSDFDRRIWVNHKYVIKLDLFYPNWVRQPPKMKRIEPPDLRYFAETRGVTVYGYKGVIQELLSVEYAEKFMTDEQIKWWTLFFHKLSNKYRNIDDFGFYYQGCHNIGFTKQNKPKIFDF